MCTLFLFCIHVPSVACVPIKSFQVKLYGSGQQACGKAATATPSVGMEGHSQYFHSPTPHCPTREPVCRTRWIYSYSITKEMCISVSCSEWTKNDGDCWWRARHQSTHYLHTLLSFHLCKQNLPHHCLAWKSLHASSVCGLWVCIWAAWYCLLKRCTIMLYSHAPKNMDTQEPPGRRALLYSTTWAWCRALSFPSSCDRDAVLFSTWC